MSAGGSGTLSGSSGHSTTKNYPAWADKYLKSFIQPASDTLGQYDSTGGQQRTDAGTTLDNTVTGQYLDPSTNPALAAELANVQRLGGEAFQTNLQSMRGGEQGAGMLQSSGAAAAQADAARKSAADISGQEASLLGQQYSQERGYQQQAIPEASSFGYQPMQMALQIAQMFKGLTGRQAGNQSGWSTTGGVSYGAGSGGGAGG
jgi:hypothetical protein